MYCDEDVYRLMNKNKDRKSVIYARVSSTCQKKDLENQIETLRTFCNKNGVVVSDEYADVCSGMNLDRKNFQKLLDEVTEYKVKSVYVTYKDRLTRLSFDMFKRLFSKYGTEIVVLNEIDNPKEIEKEIFEEIITLLHSFSMKMYSSRRKEKLQLMEKDLRLQAQVDENINEEY
jgi:predicted site-specific integrase-resolvase